MEMEDVNTGRPKISTPEAEVETTHRQTHPTVRMMRKMILKVSSVSAVKVAVMEKTTSDRDWKTPLTRIQRKSNYKYSCKDSIPRY
eukprot:556872-Amphidinium_carterae.3